MPGKVNPVLPEATLMVCAQVVGNDATIAWAGARGSFELNVQMPVIARNLLESIRILSTSTTVAGRRGASTGSPPTSTGCVPTPSPPLSVVTPLNKHLGYEEAAKIAKQAWRTAPPSARP